MLSGLADQTQGQLTLSTSVPAGTNSFTVDATDAVGNHAQSIVSYEEI